MGEQDIYLNAEIYESSDHAPTIPDERAQTQPMPVEYDEENSAYRNLIQGLPAIPAFNIGEDKLRHMPEGDQGSGWQNCLTSVEKYDRDLCQAYREQIDTLLVFAGLFSAVVTAFAVESYQWLQDDPMDTSVELLRDVVGLLALNSNLTVSLPPSSPSRLSDTAIVRINSFWFLSLSLSLSAALVGILCKQWLREFERNVGQSPEIALSVRYVRFQGFEFWRVGSIVTSVPIIMQLALAFFIIGIIELLWRLHTIVACCVTVSAALTLTFYLATTLLPVVQYASICMRCCMKPLRNRYYLTQHAFTEPQCAFKSAQAWLAFRIARPVIDRLLRAFGYEFSSRRSPMVFERLLRLTDSWVDFDLNWVKCREDIHRGPRCAFECLSWIAGNLGELHMSSWIWHCLWARWLKSRDPPGNLTPAIMDIESVATAYRGIEPLGGNTTPLAQSQALIFQCSLRTDLPADTAIELLLRVSAVAGANSKWTANALHAIRVVYHNLSFRLSDDIAIRLFRLAEQQTRDILVIPDGQDPASQWQGALGFMDIAIILQEGTHLHDIFMPAMSSLILQWLRSRPPPAIERAARAAFGDMIWYLVCQGYRGPGLENLRQRRGIMFIAKLAGVIANLWPDYVHGAYVHHPDARAVLRQLLIIFLDGISDLFPGHSGDRTDPTSFAGAQEGRSSPPVSHTRTGLDDDDAAPAGPRDTLARSGGPSQLSIPGHICVDVHGDMQADAERMAIDVNGPASPAGTGSRVAPDSSPYHPTESPDLPSSSVC